MSIRTAKSQWDGTLKEGKGTMKVGSGAFEGAFTFASRFEEAPGTNPDELIGAAISGCFSMFLSAVLSKEGYTPTSIVTEARVHLGEEGGAPKITKIELQCEAIVPGLEDKVFQEKAAFSKEQCPVSKSLTGTEVVLAAHLKS